MQFLIAATAFLFAAAAQGQHNVHGHQHLHPRNPDFGKQYSTGIFYVNWAIYARQHFVYQLPADHLSTVQYGFANVNSTTGEVILSDEWADTQYPYPDDVPTNSSQLRGNFNQLYKLKQKNRHLKVIVSVGGWSFRGNFKPALSTAAGRQRFADSTTRLIADLGIDGFDWDWEYPEDETDGANLIDTLRRCRMAWDAYSAKYANNYHFEIGISAPAGPERYVVMPIAEMDRYVDTWNLMAFDYQGPGFSNYTGHLSNVYPSKVNPKSTDGWNSKKQAFVPFNTEAAIEYYKARVASPCKIRLGMPLYGRSFAGVVDTSLNDHGMGKNYNGSGDGTWTPGELAYNQTPLNGSDIFHDQTLLASWSWDAARKQVNSFDTPKVATWKTDYLKSQGLGGAWWWESSYDRNITDPNSLVATVVNRLGGTGNLKKSWNNLYYPTSKFYNIQEASKNLGK